VLPTGTQVLRTTGCQSELEGAARIRGRFGGLVSAVAVRGDRLARCRLEVSRSAAAGHWAGGIASPDQPAGIDMSLHRRRRKAAVNRVGHNGRWPLFAAPGPQRAPGGRMRKHAPLGGRPPARTDVRRPRS